MSYDRLGFQGEHQFLVIGTAGLDMHVWPRTATVEPGRSNPGNIRWGWGGVARNIAENLARLGGQVQFITAVGEDDAGHNLLTQIQALGVDTSYTLVVPGQSTGSYVAVYHLDGQIRLAFDDMQVVREITPGHLNRHRSLFREADMICIDANLSARTLKTVFRLARQYDVPVCADPTTALLAHRLHSYFPELTVITPDLVEAKTLLGDNLPDDEAIIYGARRLVQLGVDLAVITLGADGLVYATPEESGRLPAFKIDVVDRIGAGDALTAAVAYALAEEVSPEEAVRLGMAAAAQTLMCYETVCPDLNLEILYDRLVV